MRTELMINENAGTYIFTNTIKEMKNETQVRHWPGPYKASQLDENTVQITLDRYYVHECIHIADVHVMSGNLGEEVPKAVATAELFASAPALLKENQELKEKHELTIHNLNTIANERDKMESINVELLAALELVLEAFDFDKNDSFVFDNIQSAINKAKGI